MCQLFTLRYAAPVLETHGVRLQAEAQKRDLPCNFTAMPSTLMWLPRPGTKYVQQSVNPVNSNKGDSAKRKLQRSGLSVATSQCCDSPPQTARVPQRQAFHVGISACKVHGD